MISFIVYSYNDLCMKRHTSVTAIETVSVEFLADPLKCNTEQFCDLWTVFGCSVQCDFLTANAVKHPSRLFCTHFPFGSRSVFKRFSRTIHIVRACDETINNTITIGCGLQSHWINSIVATIAAEDETTQRKQRNNITQHDEYIDLCKCSCDHDRIIYGVRRRRTADELQWKCKYTKKMLATKMPKLIFRFNFINVNWSVRVGSGAILFSQTN